MSRGAPRPADAALRAPTAVAPATGSGAGDDAQPASIAEVAEGPLAGLAAALFAVDPEGSVGVCLRAPPGPLRDRWLARMQALLPEGTPWRRVPLGIGDERLLGGLDLAASVRTGRPVFAQGLLDASRGGVLLLSMAERIAAGTAARIVAALDVRGPDAGARRRTDHAPRALAAIALDEGIDDDERPPGALLDRMAFHIDLAPLRHDVSLGDCSRDDVAGARARLPGLATPADVTSALCEIAAAMGIDSLRAPLLALRVARAAAALGGRAAVDSDDAALAVRLVLAPRATRWPAAASSDTAPEELRDAPPPVEQTDPAEDALPDPPGEPDGEATEGTAGDAPAGDPVQSAPPAPAFSDPPGATNERADDGRRHPERIADVVLAAALAAVPAGLLAADAHALANVRGASAHGRSGALARSAQRGRPLGATRGDPREGGRLDLLATLRAAAPWQALRARAAADIAPAGAGRTPVAIGAATHVLAPTQPAAAPVTPARSRLRIERDDFRVRRYAQRTESTTILVVDASGSSAMHRLAEAKGAAETLLADCYVRRDRVAVIAFRDRAAEVLLPPTRSLVRAKRSLAGLPGGGGTPLAAGIEAARAAADGVRRRGGTPTIVFLTDGRANIARGGAPGRPQALADALGAARALRAAAVPVVVVDTSPRPQPAAAQLAAAMGARYVALPCGAAGALAATLRDAGAPGMTARQRP